MDFFIIDTNLHQIPYSIYQRSFIIKWSQNTFNQIQSSASRPRVADLFGILSGVI